jgi:hypothetical protein
MGYYDFAGKAAGRHVPLLSTKTGAPSWKVPPSLLPARLAA